MASHSSSSIARRGRNALIVATLSLAVFGIAHAQPSLKSLHRFDIAAQSTSEALNSFAKQAGLRLLFPYDVLENRNTSAINGEFSAEEVLQKLLAGTELRYEITKDSVVLIRAPEAASSSSSVSARDPHSLGNSHTGLRLAQAEANQSDSPSQSDSSSSDTKAAPALEEIVVTAEKREESIQSLPIAISAFSGETLDNRGIGGLESLQQVAPSLQVLDVTGLEARVAIRGISTEIGGGEPAAAMSKDGVTYSHAHLFSGDFFDVERIEFLRGPQGTISGRNATAGAIHIYSTRPTEEFEGGIKATYGNYDRLGVEGYLSGPIADDRLLGRLAVRTDRADGWVTNNLLGQELGTIDKAQARASFLARLSDRLEAHLILDGLRDRSTPFMRVYVDDGRLRPDTPTLTEVLGIPDFDRNDNEVQLDNPYSSDKERYQATLRLAWDLGPSAKLTVVTGYVDLDVGFEFDNDGIEDALIVHNEILRNTAQASQEVTLTMDLTDRLDMLMGALYLNTDHHILDDLGVPPVGITSLVSEFDHKLSSWAGYTQWRYRLTDKIRATAGVRYTHDTKDLARRLSVNGAQLPFLEGEDSWNAWTPRFALDYAPNDDLTLYASVSRGFKSGGLQPRGILDPLSPYEPEYVWNHEVGAKANWLDGRLKTTLTGFYMDYTDLQAVLTFFDQNAGTIRGEITNAKSATISGLELEVDALVTDRLRFNFAGTWLDATYDELRNVDSLFPELGEPLPEAPSGPNFRDLSGNQVVRAPEWQFNVAGEYRAPLGQGFLGGDLEGVLGVSYAWQDRVFYDVFNNEEISQGAYGLINLFGMIEAADGRWQLSAFVHNLTDQNYYTNATALVGLAPVPYKIAFIGEPRRYGISLAYNF